LPDCFVLMPIGCHPDAQGRPIDFDRIYCRALRPAIVAAGLRPVRDDDAGAGGLVQALTFEALLRCDYAVAELTTPNPNVLYELGIRHAARPWGTLAVTARPAELPFAVHALRCIRYDLAADNALSRGGERRLRAALAGELTAVRARAEAGAPRVDSPVFQLVTDWRPV
jgi:hypothetical protein